MPQKKKFLTTRQWILVALFTALTCVATLVIQIPTPTTGYIHPGDGLVLLSGLLLGPAAGALAAGIGSALADLLAGYAFYGPVTLLIKALAAGSAGWFFRIFIASGTAGKKFRRERLLVAASGLLGEGIVLLGYFSFDTLLFGCSGGEGAAFSMQAGLLAAGSSLPMNLIQGAFGIGLAVLLYPVLRRGLKREEESL